MGYKFKVYDRITDDLVQPRTTCRECLQCEKCQAYGPCDHCSRSCELLITTIRRLSD